MSKFQPLLAALLIVFAAFAGSPAALAYSGANHAHLAAGSARPDMPCCGVDCCDDAVMCQHCCLLLGTGVSSQGEALLPNGNLFEPFDLWTFGYAYAPDPPPPRNELS